MFEKDVINLEKVVLSKFYEDKVVLYLSNTKCTIPYKDADKFEFVFSERGTGEGLKYKIGSRILLFNENKGGIRQND